MAVTYVGLGTIGTGVTIAFSTVLERCHYKMIVQDSGRILGYISTLTGTI